jgi:cytochrome c553
MRAFHILMLAALAALAGVSACSREEGGAGDVSTPPASASTAADSPAGPAPPNQLGLCASCHGRDGIAVIAGTPNLAGRPREELLAAMQAYLDGTRDYAPMRAMLGPIRPEQRERLADWFAAQPAPSATTGATQ